MKKADKPVSKNYSTLVNYPSRMAAKSKALNTYSHKYYSTKPKNLLTALQRQ